jgi:hypothetical protein
MEKSNSKFDPPETESCQRITRSRDKDNKSIRDGPFQIKKSFQISIVKYGQEKDECVFQRNSMSNAGDVIGQGLLQIRRSLA